MDNEGGVVNERIMAKLSVQPPSAFLVQTYLEKIADQFEVNWTPKDKIRPDQLAAPMSAPIGYSVQTAPGTGLAPPESYPISTAPPAAAAPAASDNVSVLSGSSAPMNDSSSNFSKPDPIVTTATVMPVVPVPPSINDEVDIVIPPAPGYEGGTSGGGASSGGEDDFDSLQARFQNLKR